jgi:hypothetical protein
VSLDGERLVTAGLAPQFGFAGMVKVRCGDSTEPHPVKSVSTYHSTLPLLMLTSAEVAVVSPAEAKGAPLTAIQRR